MIGLYNATFLDSERLDGITRVVIDEPTIEKPQYHRVHIQIGQLSIHMNLDQCISLANALNEKVIPIIEARQAKELKELHLEVGDSMNLKDSIG